MIARILLVPLAALMVAAEPAITQPASPPASPPAAPRPIDADTRQAVIESASRLLIDGYVYEDRARGYAAKLAAYTAAGRYDTLQDRAAFAGAPSNRSCSRSARCFRATAKPVARKACGAELTASPFVSLASSRGTLRM